MCLTAPAGPHRIPDARATAARPPPAPPPAPEVDPAHTALVELGERLLAEFHGAPPTGGRWTWY